MMVNPKLKVILPLAFLAACAGAGMSHPKQLYAKVGMAARELNSQEIMKSSTLSLSEKESSGISVDGPLELVTAVGGKRMSFDVNGPNSRVLIAGWHGANQEFRNIRLSTIGFFVSDHEKSYSDALSESKQYCDDAYSAGLRPTKENYGVMNNLSEKDIGKVSKITSGMTVCHICNLSECFSAEIWPSRYQNPVATFGVNIVLSSFVDITRIRL